MQSFQTTTIAIDDGTTTFIKKNKVYEMENASDVTVVSNFNFFIEVIVVHFEKQPLNV